MVIVLTSSQYYNQIRLTEISSKITHGVNFPCLQRLDSVDEPYINDNAGEEDQYRNLHQGFVLFL